MNKKKKTPQITVTGYYNLEDAENRKKETRTVTLNSRKEVGFAVRNLSSINKTGRRELFNKIAAETTEKAKTFETQKIEKRGTQRVRVYSKNVTVTKEEAKLQRTYSPALSMLTSGENYGVIKTNKDGSIRLVASRFEKLPGKQQKEVLLNLQKYNEAKTATLAGALENQKNIAKQVFGSSKGHIGELGQVGKNEGQQSVANLFWQTYKEGTEHFAGLEDYCYKIGRNYSSEQIFEALEEYAMGGLDRIYNQQIRLVFSKPLGGGYYSLPHDRNFGYFAGVFLQSGTKDIKIDTSAGNVYAKFSAMVEYIELRG